MKIHQEISDRPLLKKSVHDPFQRAGFIKRALFVWVFPLVNLGRRHFLNQDDLYQIRPKDDSLSQFKRFQHYYTKYKGDDKGRLQWAVWKTNTRDIYVNFFFFALITSFALTSPLMQQWQQSFFSFENKSEKQPLINFLFFLLIQFAMNFLVAVLKPGYQFQNKMLGTHIQGALQQKILQNTMKFPLQRNQIYKPGDLVNMLQVDVYQATNYYNSIYQLIVIPFQLVLTITICYLILGKNSYIIIATSLLQFICSMLFGYIYGKLQKKFMHCKDLRMRSFDEMMLGVKQIKLNSYEAFFEDRINKLRISELKQLKYQIVMQTITTFFLSICTLGSFELTFYFSSQITLQLITNIASNSSAIVGVLQNIPSALKDYISSKNSIQRINLFMNQPGISQSFMIDEFTEKLDQALVIKEGQFKWVESVQKIDTDTLELRKKERQLALTQAPFSFSSLNLSVKQGEYVAIIGNAGSGKSSIISALLGEMETISMEACKVYGRISLAMQEPWILNASFKENITFGQEFDEKRYNEVVRVCGLKEDLDRFEDGHNTLLVEKGDNISGGQKKRINLARCVYRDADIYILDDPLSALDVKISTFINENCINTFLKNKTRIFFSNTIAGLQKCDQIYLIDNGEFIFKGSFAETIKFQKTSSIASEGPHFEPFELTQQKLTIDTKFESEHYERQPSHQEQDDSKFYLINKEDQNIGQVKSIVIKQLIKFYGGCWFTIALILLMLVNCAFNLLTLLSIAYGSDKDATPEEIKRQQMISFPQNQIPLSLSFNLIQLLIFLCGLKTSRVIHQKVIRNLLQASITKFYNLNLIGRLMNRISKDIYNIDLMFPPTVLQMVGNITAVLTSLITASFTMNFYALPFLVIYLLTLTYIAVIFLKSLREVTRIESVSKSPIFSFYSQLIRGLSYVRNCLPFTQIQQIHTTNINRDLSNQVCLYGIEYWFQFTTLALSAVMQPILYITCYQFSSDDGQQTYYGIYSIMSIQAILSFLTVNYGDITTYLISFERCLSLVNDIPIEDYTKNVIPIRSSMNSENAIEYSDASFHYREGLKPCLSSLNLRIKQGEKIGVVGRTGAGKSSIILSLADMLEQITGQLYVHGLDIKEYGLAELRQQYAIIPQDPLVFEGTLLDNIDPYKQRSLQDVERVLTICHLQDYPALQRGLNSSITVSGGNLSMGQKQLITVARCLLSQRRIILIDEATANIDRTTEQIVQKIFEEQFKMFAVIAIAHKITTIVKSDRIAVMQHGQITELDTPQNLLDDPNSEFNQIYQMIKRNEQL